MRGARLAIAVVLASCTPYTPPCFAHCPGCCDERDVCHVPAHEGACGAQGIRCVACTVGEQACQDGVCVPFECARVRCKGCCDRGRCVESPSAAACGGPGQNCIACAGGMLCDERGFCSPRCSASNCEGCCDGDACVVTPTARQCGARGIACTNCFAGLVCDLQKGFCRAPFPDGG